MSATRCSRVGVRIPGKACCSAIPFTSEWTQALAGTFDAVISAIAIHNVRYPERIRAIYSEIFDVLVPGGCFLNYDLIFMSGPSAANAYEHAKSLTSWIREGNREASPPAASPAVRSTQARESITLEQQLSWLREAGFQEVECFWKEMQSAIIGGFRPADTSVRMSPPLSEDSLPL